MSYMIDINNNVIDLSAKYRDLLHVQLNALKTFQENNTLEYAFEIAKAEAVKLNISFSEKGKPVTVSRFAGYIDWWMNSLKLSIEGNNPYKPKSNPLKRVGDYYEDDKGNRFVKGVIAWAPNKDHLKTLNPIRAVLMSGLNLPVYTTTRINSADLYSPLAHAIDLAERKSYEQDWEDYHLDTMI